MMKELWTGLNEWRIRENVREREEEEEVEEAQ